MPPRTGPHRPGSATRHHPATSRSTQAKRHCAITAAAAHKSRRSSEPTTPAPAARQPSSPPSPASRQPSSPASPGGSPVQRSPAHQSQQRCRPQRPRRSQRLVSPLLLFGPQDVLQQFGRGPAVARYGGAAVQPRNPHAHPGRDGPAIPAAIQPPSTSSRVMASGPQTFPRRPRSFGQYVEQPATGLAPNPGVRRPGLPTVRSGSATGSATASRWRPRGHRRRPAGARSAPARPRSWTDPGGRTGHAQGSELVEPRS